MNTCAQIRRISYFEAHTNQQPNVVTAPWGRGSTSVKRRNVLELRNMWYNDLLQVYKNQTLSQYNTFHSKLRKMRAKVPKFRTIQHWIWKLLRFRTEIAEKTYPAPRCSKGIVRVIFHLSTLKSCKIFPQFNFLYKTGRNPWWPWTTGLVALCLIE